MARATKELAMVRSAVGSKRLASGLSLWEIVRELVLESEGRK